MDANSLGNSIAYARSLSYVNAGSIAILVFDSFLTFDQEIRTIWSQKWNYIRVLYVLTRYLAFLEAGVTIYRFTVPGESYATCLLLYRACSFSIIFGLGIGEVILTIRTWTAWDKNRTLTYALPVFFIFVWGVGIAITGIFLRTLRFIAYLILFFSADPSPLTSYVGCHLTRGDSIVFIPWILFLFYDTVMLILMAIPAWRVYRSRDRSRLTEVVHRDGVLYYLYLFVLSLANIIMALASPTALATIIALLSRMIHALLACRVVLHIHECGNSIQDLDDLNQHH